MNSHFESDIHFFLLLKFPKNPSKSKPPCNIQQNYSFTTAPLSNLQPGAQITTVHSICFHVHTYLFSVFPVCNLRPRRVMRGKACVKLLNLNQNFLCCVRSGSRDGVAGTVARYCPDSLGIAVRFPVEVGYISPLQSVQTRSAGHATSYSLGMANFPQSYDIQDVKLTTH
jgi:hypothetical protein